MFSGVFFRKMDDKARVPLIEWVGNGTVKFFLFADYILLTIIGSQAMRRAESSGGVGTDCVFDARHRLCLPRRQIKIGGFGDGVEVVCEGFNTYAEIRSLEAWRKRKQARLQSIRVVVGEPRAVIIVNVSPSNELVEKELEEAVRYFIDAKLGGVGEVIPLDNGTLEVRGSNVDAVKLRNAVGGIADKINLRSPLKSDILKVS